MAYYSDSPLLSTSTSIYQDANLTIYAPDGYYSDQTISRRQVSGILQPAETCANCGSTPDAVLTFVKYTVENTDTKYSFRVLPAIDADITVDLLRVDVYDTATKCGIGAMDYIYNDTCSGATITSGTTAVVAIGDGLPIGVTCADAGGYYYHTLDSLSVNGTTLSDGDTITIGSFLVRIEIFTNCRAIEATC